MLKKKEGNIPYMCEYVWMGERERGPLPSAPTRMYERAFLHHHFQEEGNIPYVLDNGVGAFETRPPFIAETLQRWLGPGSSKGDSKGELEGMAARSKALGRPEAVYKIVEDLAR